MFAITIQSAVSFLGQPEPSSGDLIDVLSARAAQVETFSATVGCSIHDGPEKQRVAADLRQLVAWAMRHSPDDVEGLQKSVNQMERQNPVEFHLLRYFAHRDGRFRIEDFGAGPSDAIEPAIFVFDGDKWTTFLPASRSAVPNSTAYMNVAQKENLHYYLEVARGAANPAGARWGKAGASPLAMSRGQIYWDELEPLLDLESASVEMTVLPSGRSAALLELATPRYVNERWPNLNMGLARFRLWLDPTVGYLPLRLENQSLEPSDTEGHRYLNNQVVDSECGSTVGRKRGDGPRNQDTGSGFFERRCQRTPSGRYVSRFRP
jgi:hypothetical protein